jgi:hypothetical protein
MARGLDAFVPAGTPAFASPSGCGPGTSPLFVAIRARKPTEGAGRKSSPLTVRQKVEQSLEDILRDRDVVPKALDRILTAQRDDLIEEIVRKLDLISKAGHQTDPASTAESLARQRVQRISREFYSRYLELYYLRQIGESKPVPLAFSGFTTGSPSPLERLSLIEERGFWAGMLAAPIGNGEAPRLVRCVTHTCKIILQGSREGLEPKDLVRVKNPPSPPATGT